MALGNTYALRVWMKPDVLAQYGLTPDDVGAAINSQSFVTAVGNFGEQSKNKYQLSMEYKGTLKDIGEFEEIVLKTTDGGHVLHLRDVAEIEIGAKSYSFVSNVNGDPGTFMLIFQAPGSNATEVNQRIDKMCEDLKATMPDGLEFATLMNADDFLFAAIHNVVETLVIAIILVILVVFFFLQNVKATIIPSISVIVSLMGTFIIVTLAGFSLNLLTLFALVLAIGTVVDDAIVVVEAVMAKMEGGITDAKEATRLAVGEVSMAVFSCTLVFMAVFIPVTFISGTSGTFFTQFGITIASAVGLSCLQALTTCPALCAIMLKVTEDKKEGGKSLLYYTKKAYDASYNALFDKYSIMVEVNAPEGYTLEQTYELLGQVEEKVKAIPELESYAVVSGYGLISGQGSSYGFMVVRLKNWEERPGIEHCVDMVMYRFYTACADIKNATVIPFQMPQIPGYGTSNNVNLVVEDPTDGDLSEFSKKTDNFLAKLMERKEVSMAMSTYSEKFPKYRVEVDPTQCSRSGLSAREVLNTLGAYCSGSYIANYNQFGKVYQLWTAAAPEYRLDPTSLNNIFVKTSSGKMAPLSEFVSLKEMVGPSNNQHFNLFSSIECQVVPASGYSEGQVQEVIAEVFRQEMPTTATYEYSSMSRETAEAAGSNTTTLIYCICIVLIYLIMGSLYNSWFTPWAVLLSIPFGLMGAFSVIWLCASIGLPGMENNVYVQTGVVMLIGLLAKTAILITEVARRYGRRYHRTALRRTGLLHYLPEDARAVPGQRSRRSRKQ